MEKTKSPFDLLLEEMTLPGDKPGAPVEKQTATPVGKLDFKFNSLLKNNNQRQSKRVNVTGMVSIFNSAGEPLTKAVLRNVSATGIAAEMYPVEIVIGAEVLLDVSTSSGLLGRLKCKVLWIENIESHPKGHKNIGLTITEGDTPTKAKFESFVKGLYVGKS